MNTYNEFLTYEIANSFWCSYSTGKFMDEIVVKFIVRKTKRKYKKFLELNNKANITNDLIGNCKIGFLKRK